MIGPRKFIIWGVLCALLLPLLLVGWVRELGPLLLEFPPLTQYVEHAPFSPVLFGLFTALALGAALVLCRPRWFGFKPVAAVRSSNTGKRPFPWWGYVGGALIVIVWPVAWIRPAALPGWVVNHTFFPLWLGYILWVDGWAHRRAGESWVATSPRLFGWLFPASAIAWWYFELLNRFVQNWWYAGVETFSGMHYALMATISFSTVFPAIFVTRNWLLTHPWFQRAYRNGPNWPAPRKSRAALGLLVGIVGLVLLACYPVPLFFLTWLAPLIVLASGLSLAGVTTPFTHLQRGDYTGLVTLAVAALICGFFWECWNVFSMPKWHYSIPYVQALHLFEMPLPGYAGYLPFGPACWCLWLAMKRGVENT